MGVRIESCGGRSGHRVVGLPGRDGRNLSGGVTRGGTRGVARVTGRERECGRGCAGQGSNGPGDGALWRGRATGLCGGAGRRGFVAGPERGGGAGGGGCEPGWCGRWVGCGEVQTVPVRSGAGRPVRPS
ncbi:hypothetical protein GCM10010524_45650 [Streptomyces mexicanus]